MNLRRVVVWSLLMLAGWAVISWGIVEYVQRLDAIP